MPLYEYECFVCGHRFERIQRFSDSPASECPACGGSVRRLLGVPALQFKGSGFYITDYGKGDGSGSQSSSSAKEESSSASPESTPPPKPDAAPDAPPEPKGGVKRKNKPS
jgi:putative FmdB family regulatory protein